MSGIHVRVEFVPLFRCDSHSAAKSSGLPPCPASSTNPLGPALAKAKHHRCGSGKSTIQQSTGRGDQTPDLTTRPQVAQLQIFEWGKSPSCKHVFHVFMWCELMNLPPAENSEFTAPAAHEGDHVPLGWWKVTVAIVFPGAQK